jgi:acyl phosphate:glycerol-3-phosphate acyltransferase
MNTALLLAFAYLAGAIPTGYWVVKAKTGVDLTQVGSGSTGTTNVLRTAGKSAAAFVFFVDILKGWAPVFLSIYAVQHGWVPELGDAAPWLPFVVALLTLIGHSKSIFLKFKGGKSAATGLGNMIAMNPIAALCTFGIFVSVVLLTRYVSLASMIAVTCSGIPYITFCAVGAVYVVLRHKENIKRLLSGTEPKIGQKAEIPPAEPPSKVNKG